jgi:hypothetical protein
MRGRRDVTLRRSTRALLAVLAAITVGASALDCTIAAGAVAHRHRPPAATGPVRLRPGRLPGPSSVSLGLVDSSLFLNSSGAFRDGWLARARALGSSFVRITTYWSLIAPTRPADPSNPADPSYDFSTLDSAVRAATARGENVMLLVGWAPTWAESQPIPPNVMAGAWEPNPGDLGHFATALARRYSGHFHPFHGGGVLPQVSYFQAWNEPNLDRYLMPQWYQYSTTGGFVPASPGIYRSMLNAFYSGVKSVEPGDTVLAAGLAPYGDPPGGHRMTPVLFLEQMLCLDSSLQPSGSCPNPAHFDALDDHPYGLTPTAKAHNPANVGVPDLGKISRVVHAAQRYNLVLPAGPKPLWVTELAWSDVPPSPPSTASLALQARYLPLGFYELWRQGVAHMFWFQLRDPPNSPNSFSGAGLYFLSGAAKPSAATYRFPFIAIPARHKKLTIWGLAPTPGQVLIEKRVGRRWRAVLSLTSTSGGIFYANHRLGSHLVLRAVAGASVSPAWATSGPM